MKTRLEVDVHTSHEAGTVRLVVAVNEESLIKPRYYSIQEYNRLADWNPHALKDDITQMVCLSVDEYILKYNMSELKTY